jgi:recombination protein RecT
METKELTTKQESPIDSVRNSLTAMANDFKMALPAHVTPEKFIRVVLTSLRMNPALLNCDRTSLFASAMRCAQDGLLPDGREAALVQFGNKVQYMPMIGGICKKARNSGEISALDAQVVHSNDEYNSWIDEKGQHFNHKKARKDRGEPVLTYAYAISKDGTLYFEEMTEDEMKEVRKISRAGSSGPWSGPFQDEMRRKTALRRLAKYRIPSSSDLDDVIRVDDEMYDTGKLDDTKAKKLNEKFGQRAPLQIEKDFNTVSDPSELGSGLEIEQ